MAVAMSNAERVTDSSGGVLGWWQFVGWLGERWQLP